MLPNPATLTNWVENSIADYNTSNKANEALFVSQAERFLQGKVSINELQNQEKELFHNTRTTEILEMYANYKNSPNFPAFSHIKDIEEKDFIARILLCYDQNKHTWKDICDIIKFTGKCYQTISTTYKRLFTKKKTYSPKEKIKVLQMKDDCCMECQSLPGRTFKQNEEIFQQAQQTIQKAYGLTSEGLSKDQVIVGLSCLNDEKDMLIDRLNSIIAFLLKERENFEHLKDNDTALKVISALLEQRKKNIGEKTGSRYDSDLMDLIVLSFVSSPSEYDILTKELGFPTARTAQAYKKKIFTEMFPNATDIAALLDGSEEHVKTLMEIFFSPIDKNKKHDIVLAIDACSLNANVILSLDGTVTGLTQTKSISLEEACEIIEDKHLFDKFLSDHCDEIECAAFVVLFIPTDPSLPSFPILSKKTCSGSATKEIESDLMQLAGIVNSLGENVIGIGCDGDVEWLHFGMEFVELIKTRYNQNLNVPLFEQYIDVHFPLVFYDTLHLGKNLRYYFSKAIAKCLWLTSQEPTVGKNDFIECGINEKLFDDSEKSKCYDCLVRELYSFENIKKCLNANRKDLAFALLIMTLLFEAVFAEDISREQRLNFLSIGHAIAFIYLNDLDDYKTLSLPSNLFQKDRAGKYVKKQSLYERPLIVKYLLLTYSLSLYISKGTALNLGALGSHLLEHFFGLMRRVTNFDESPIAYDASIKKILMYKHLCEELEIDIFSRKRSDSGQKLPAFLGNISSISWGQALATAINIIEKTGIYITSYSKFNNIIKNIEPLDADKLLGLTRNDIIHKAKACASMRGEFYGMYSGVERVTRISENSYSKKEINEKVKHISLQSQQIRGYFQDKKDLIPK